MRLHQQVLALVRHPDHEPPLPPAPCRAHLTDADECVGRVQTQAALNTTVSHEVPRSSVVERVSSFTVDANVAAEDEGF